MTVVEQYGHTVTLAQLLRVLHMSPRTAARRIKAGTFPIPMLPRNGQAPYRFASARVDRYLQRAEHGVVLSMRGVA